MPRHSLARSVTSREKRGKEGEEGSGGFSRRSAWTRRHGQNPTVRRPPPPSPRTHSPVSRAFSLSLDTPPTSLLDLILYNSPLRAFLLQGTSAPSPPTDRLFEVLRTPQHGQRRSKIAPLFSGRSSSQSHQSAHRQYRPVWLVSTSTWAMTHPTRYDMQNKMLNSEKGRLGPPWQRGKEASSARRRKLTNAPTPCAYYSTFLVGGGRRERRSREGGGRRDPARPEPCGARGPP